MKAHITELLAQAAKSLTQNADFDGSNFTIHLERPKNKDHGDFSTNLAMLLAKPLRQNPRAIAESLIKALPTSAYVEKVEIAGAGFINFYLGANATISKSPQVVMLKMLNRFGHFQSLIYATNKI